MKDGGWKCCLSDIDLILLSWESQQHKGRGPVLRGSPIMLIKIFVFSSVQLLFCVGIDRETAKTADMSLSAVCNNGASCQQPDEGSEG